MATDSTLADVAAVGIVVGIVLWVAGAIYVLSNGDHTILAFLWLPAWVLLPVSVGIHAGVNDTVNPWVGAGLALASALPFVGLLPASYYLGKTTGG